MRIILVRHAESEANLNKNLWATMADCNIPLSVRGREQARECGEHIKQYYQSIYNTINAPKDRQCVLWTSPYERARQTSAELCSVLHDWVDRKHESPLLAEQQFGLYEGVDWESVADTYPKETEYYRKYTEKGAKYWVKMPLGESRFDVSVRVSQIFPLIHRENYQKGVSDVIIVSHGVAIRAFIMMWMHYSPEWMYLDPNPVNCEVRVIHGHEYLGCYWKPRELYSIIPYEPTDKLLGNNKTPKT
uniref:Phosphoglycerate mutase n=1 Tax=Arcella intermedia TaxID=1963864 RepID=A0A6B2LFB1_9EUKA